ncbi:MAG: hypothetical protein OIN84_01790 [Candidatus Methanoperedens sp.]|nr:hypothetical protein [Candidatus Methanoperedens sp.]
MVRRLEKIEKEMGYCEIKIEKERRLRTQVEFLQADIEALEKFMKLYESSGMNLQNLPFEKIAQQVALERARKDRLGPFFKRAKEDFISAGILEMLRNEREILVRERESIETKLASFTGFGKKRSVLEHERTQALRGLLDGDSLKLRKLAESFTQVEEQWNSLTEDALNLDEGIFYLVRNVDYIKSSKSFLIAAKGGFEIESWVESRYSGDLFRHSNIGRAKEMIDGANRNLKLAQKELCCVASMKFRLDGFEPTLVLFLDALFDDIFAEARLIKCVDVVDEALTRSEKALLKVRSKRETLHAKLERIERSRSLLFQRLGSEKRGKVSAN